MKQITFNGLIFLGLGLFVANALGREFDCTDLTLKPFTESTFSSQPIADFPFRDLLPRTEIPRESWNTCCGSYGPCSLPYPAVEFPKNIDSIAWKQIRVIEAAKKLIGIAYGHHHIPEMGGLDCSNFSAFVYN